VNELERIEAQAVREAVVLGGGRGELVGGAWCVSQPRVPIMELNRAFAAGGSVDLDAIAAWFGGPHTVGTADETLQRELAERGYEPGRALMKFERNAAPAPAADGELRIEETLDAALVGQLIAGVSETPMSAMVGAPGWHCFIAWADDAPAATGSLYVDGAAAWIGVGVTDPGFRRRGAQSALLAARIEKARALGASVLATETGERLPGEPASSYNNILRAGFTEAYLRPNWKSPA